MALNVPPAPILPQNQNQIKQNNLQQDNSSLAEKLEQKRNEGLEKSETTVTNKYGEKFREILNSNGSSTLEPVNNKPSGYFMIECKTDPKAYQINDNLFIGSQDVVLMEEGLQDMRNKGITHIVNVMSSDKLTEEFECLAIQVLDVPETPIISYFDQIFTFINEAISKQGKVLVHCNAGISRSSSVLIGFLMKHEKLSYKNALTLVKKAKPSVQPNIGKLSKNSNSRLKVSNEGFENQLINYQKMLIQD